MLVVHGSHADVNTQADHDNAVLDEAFLLFLADSIDSNNELLDPLSMVEKTDTLEETNNDTHSDNKEANDE